MDELKSVKMDYKVASVALDPKGRKFVVGEDIPATWVRVYRWDDDSEVGKLHSTIVPTMTLRIKLTYPRHPQGSPRSCLVHRLLSRRQALRDRVRGRNHQVMEELRGVLRSLARWPYRQWRHGAWRRRVGWRCLAPSPIQKRSHHQPPGLVRSLSLCFGLFLGGSPK